MMPSEIQTYIIDIDRTICSDPIVHGDYSTCLPDRIMIDKTNELFDEGHTIILFTARGMRTYQEDIIDIHINVKPVLVDWLKQNGVQYNKLIMGKPWGPNVHYIDDRNMSFKEFLEQ